MLGVLCIWWTCNAKLIGLLYVYTGVVFGITGFVYSWMMRSELGGLGEQCCFGDTQYYNVLITSHAMLMIFFFIMPTLISGFGNLLLPVILGVPEMVFPKVNNLGWVILPLAYMLLLLGAQLDEGCGTAWTIYPPLACYTSHCGLSVDCFIIALHLSGISSVTGAINIIVTCCVARRAHKALISSSLYCWALLLSALLILFVVPVLAGAITMLLTDRSMNTVYFDVSAGGDVVLYQHLFWVFGHPEVYIIILPAFGMVSHCLQSEGSGELFNRLGMIYAMVSIGVVGFFVWAHHMFTVGLDIDARVYFSSITMLIALPTSIKVFSWLVSLMRCMFCSSVLMLIYGFVVMFVLGGVTGLVLANSEIDLVMHDSYFVVAHFHYVLSLGAVFGFMCGLCVVYQLVLGIVMGEHTMRLCVGLLLLGTNTVFWPMHVTGLLGFPRRISDYADQFIGYAATSYGGLVMVLLSLFYVTLSLFEVGLCVQAVRVDAGSLWDMVRVAAVQAIRSFGVCLSADRCLRDCSICHTFCAECCSGVINIYG